MHYRNVSLAMKSYTSCGLPVSTVVAALQQTVMSDGPFVLTPGWELVMAYLKHRLFPNYTV